MAALDVAGAPAQVDRLVTEGEIVCIIGGGGKSGILCCSDNGAYPHMATVDGNGNEVVLSYPEGMIAWLMAHSSHYNPETDNSEIKPVFNILNIIKAPIMTVYIIFRNLVRPIFG